MLLPGYGFGHRRAAPPRREARRRSGASRRKISASFYVGYNLNGESATKLQAYRHHRAVRHRGLVSPPPLYSLPPRCPEERRSGCDLSYAGCACGSLATRNVRNDETDLPRYADRRLVRLRSLPRKRCDAWHGASGRKFAPRIRRNCRHSGAPRPFGARGVPARPGGLPDALRQCHGDVALGTAQGPPLVHIIYEPNHHADAAFLLAALRGVRAHHWGFGDMPPQPQVSREEMAEIVKYVRWLQREAGVY